MSQPYTAVPGQRSDCRGGSSLLPSGQQIAGGDSGYLLKRALLESAKCVQRAITELSTYVALQLRDLLRGLLRDLYAMLLFLAEATVATQVNLITHFPGRSDKEKRNDR
jgi:hypothetical protein